MIRHNWKLLGVPALLFAGCALDEQLTTSETDQELVLSDSTPVDAEGILNFGTVVFKQNPTTLLEQGDFHGYEIDGKAGGVVTITMTSAACGAPDTFLFLFGPEDANGNRGADLVHNDDAFFGSCFLDSRIANFRLPVTGRYLIVATSFLQQGGGHYQLLANCNNGACVPDGAETFAGSRISQGDIDAGLFSAEELFETGDFLFESVFRLQDGLGNALIGAPAGNNPPPNFRFVHFAGFGAPEAQTCVTCHNVGGDDGAGDLNHNIFQIGDGVDPASGVPRNPPVVLGLGLRQRVGEEMTTTLKGQLAAAQALAVAQNVPVTAQFSAKGVSFGSAVASPNGTVDFTNLRGVDTDFVVKPFGWKGRESLLRRFVEGGFRVHFGLQSQPSIVKNCPTPQQCNVNNFGTGQTPGDPDGDGFIEELTEGQLTAEAVYMGLLQMPVRVPSASTTDAARAAAGEQLFNSIGCATCHVRAMTANSPLHLEPADTTGGAGITLNLATDMHEPRPTPAANGSLTFELWSDFKRHDMGTALADAEDFGIIKANQFITTPLWGVATSAPYLHDGRAPTLRNAIVRHAGEGQAARDAFLALTTDNQSKVTAFLRTLGRSD
jgi:cytochrome c553